MLNYYFVFALLVETIYLWIKMKTYNKNEKIFESEKPLIIKTKRDIIILIIAWNTVALASFIDFLLSFWGLHYNILEHLQGIGLLLTIIFLVFAFIMCLIRKIKYNRQ